VTPGLVVPRVHAVEATEDAQSHEADEKGNSEHRVSFGNRHY
jgi:hypothetical protein